MDFSSLVVPLVIRWTALVLGLTELLNDDSVLPEHSQLHTYGFLVKIDNSIML